MSYKESRSGYENLNIRNYYGVGKYEIPQMSPAEYKVDNWISFNFALSCDEPEKHGVHFFIDDYQFIRLWNDPKKYIDKLKQFQAVCTPDFSMYSDFPKAVKIFNHWRKHWLGVFWQENDINVIPTVDWNRDENYGWCFDGDPIGGQVALSTVGVKHDKRSLELFEAGYTEMKRRLKPSQIIIYGEVLDICKDDNIIPVQAFLNRLKSITKEA